jgi:hypothetical protein
MEKDLKRTKRSSGENRNSVFRVRFTAAEKQLLEELANAYGYKNLSKFLRSLITKQKQSPASIDRQTLLMMNAELSKEGSNLNQIARAINIRMKTGEPIDISPSTINYTLECVSVLTQHILRILKNGHIR